MHVSVRISQTPMDSLDSTRDSQQTPRLLPPIEIHLPAPSAGRASNQCALIREDAQVLTSSSNTPPAASRIACVPGAQHGSSAKISLRSTRSWHSLQRVTAVSRVRALQALAAGLATQRHRHNRRREWSRQAVSQVQDGGSQRSSLRH